MRRDGDEDDDFQDSDDELEIFYLDPTSPASSTPDIFPPTPPSSYTPRSPSPAPTASRSPSPIPRPLIPRSPSPDFYAPRLPPPYVAIAPQRNVQLIRMVQPAAQFRHLANGYGALAVTNIFPDLSEFAEHHPERRRRHKLNIFNEYLNQLDYGRDPGPLLHAILSGHFMFNDDD